MIDPTRLTTYEYDALNHLTKIADTAAARNNLFHRHRTGNTTTSIGCGSSGFEILSTGPLNRRTRGVSCVMRI